jgi:hypothetical protein
MDAIGGEFAHGNVAADRTRVSSVRQQVLDEVTEPLLGSVYFSVTVQRGCEFGVVAAVCV